MTSKQPARQAQTMADDLLAWYDAHGRDLPWREKSGNLADPYHVWLSEIMLQQTTVATVRQRFGPFIRRWPSLAALAQADDGDILAAWAGLGYYARARHLIACARMVMTDHGGRFPETEATLAALPGIGRYTAAAVAAIAFDRQATVVDGNVERVMARLYAVATPLPAAKPLLRDHAARLTPTARPGDYAQAVMDLGATICTPRAPQCAICPWRPACAAHRLGMAEAYPAKTPKPARPKRMGVVFWLESDGAVLLCRRPTKGLLGGMMALPSSGWRAALRLEDGLAEAPIGASWWPLPGQVRHIFTHFELSLTVARAAIDSAARPAGDWRPIAAVLDAGLPTVFAKAARHALMVAR